MFLSFYKEFSESSYISSKLPAKNLVPSSFMLMIEDILFIFRMLVKLPLSPFVSFILDQDKNRMAYFNLDFELDFNNFKRDCKIRNTFSAGMHSRGVFLLDFF